MAPSTPVVLALGLALGAGHMLSLVATGLFVARTRKQLAVNPGLQAVRSAVEEALRVATILLALLLWPTDLRGELGVWIGAGAAHPRRAHPPRGVGRALRGHDAGRTRQRPFDGPDAPAGRARLDHLPGRGDRAGDPDARAGDRHIRAVGHLGVVHPGPPPPR